MSKLAEKMRNQIYPSYFIINLKTTLEMLKQAPQDIWDQHHADWTNKAIVEFEELLNREKGTNNDDIQTIRDAIKSCKEAIPSDIDVPYPDELILAIKCLENAIGNFIEKNNESIRLARSSNEIRLRREQATTLIGKIKDNASRLKVSTTADITDDLIKKAGEILQGIKELEEYLGISVDKVESSTDRV